jgi:exopolysaccharide biosynthesis polyprenyl glycosylphosphotransferase
MARVERRRAALSEMESSQAAITASESNGRQRRASLRLVESGPRGGFALRKSERDLIVDLLMLILAVLTEELVAPHAGIAMEGPVWLLAFPLMILAALAIRGTYRPRIARRFLEDARSVIAATAVAIMAVTFVHVLVTDDSYTGSQAVREWLLASGFLIVGRGIVAALNSRTQTAAKGRPTLIVGAGHVGQLLAKRLHANPQFGLRPVGYVDDAPRDLNGAGMDLPVVGNGANLEMVVREWEVEHAILCFSKASHDEALRMSRTLQRLGVSVSVVPRLYEDTPDRLALERVGGFPMLTIHPSVPGSWQFVIKYAIDRLVALGTIIVLSPLLLAISLGILITAGRPILFKQRRVGLDGRDFDMLKFRTMTGDPAQAGEADADWAADIAGTDKAAMNGHSNGANADGAHPERRMTALGRILRRSSLDELPQLFNVLRGEMSLIGPRPERRSYVDLFEGTIRRYGDRHRVKSGITGWAQVHGLRGKTSLADRIEWDNYYIENQSLWLDFKIVLLTVPEVFRDREKPHEPSRPHP